MQRSHLNMSKIQNISELSTKELNKFLMSFDTVLSDIDGVILYNDIPIEGAYESLKRLQNLGKQTYLVTNNNTYTPENLSKKLDLHQDYIINSTKVMIWYLKKIDFHGEILAIVCSTAWDVLTEAGLQLIKPRSYSLKDKKKIVKEILDRPSVKAVIIDFDNDCNWLKLALAVSCLKRKDVLYLTGAMDKWIIVNAQNNVERILGPGPLIQAVSTQTGRTPLVCGKPGEILKDYVLDMCGVPDPGRCLFIGDSLNQDVKFGLMCGFTKLLVGTGMDSLEQAQKEIDIRPDYYLSNLNQLFAAYKNQTTCQDIVNQKDD